MVNVMKRRTLGMKKKLKKTKTFYLKPPRGRIPFHKLQKCVEERLRSFKCLAAGVNVPAQGIEYLVEDSAFDRAGHFTLRLAAVKDRSFLQFFINSELGLLKSRLESYTGTSIRAFLKNLLRHARECIAEDISEKVHSFLNVVISIASKMLSKSYRFHVIDKTHFNDDKCKIFTLNVPFQFCTSLVTQRLVDLKNGYAKIPCEQWKDLLLSLFQTYLYIAVNEMHYSRNAHRALEDERIKLILLSISATQKFQINSQHNLQHVDQEFKYFPLCMQNLHTVLRKNHRLPHEERFNLSLFLKDIGMSVHDSVAYWRTEYSKQAACTKCTHDWYQEEKRYVYSIRHLYGLEGSRKTYNTRSCGYFQNLALGPLQEGGCPFKHFDNDKLKCLLGTNPDMDGDAVNQVLLERTVNPVGACKLFLMFMNNSAKPSVELEDDNPVALSNCDIRFSNPVQYFMLIKSLTNKGHQF